MDAFIQQHRPDVIGVLHGFDRRRFLGRRTNCRFTGPVATSYLARSERVRVKPGLQENSITMYAKQGSVLRIETMIDNARRFQCG